MIYIDSHRLEVDSRGNRYYQLIADEGDFHRGQQHPEDPYDYCTYWIPEGAGRVLYYFSTLDPKEAKSGAYRAS